MKLIDSEKKQQQMNYVRVQLAWHA